jgi:hypothetical protein
MISLSQIKYGFLVFRQGRSLLFCKYQYTKVLENFIVNK